MFNVRCVDLFYFNRTGGLCVASFSTERAALRCAREEGHTSFEISILGRVLVRENWRRV